MQSIANNGIITMNAGDSFTTYIYLNAGNEAYPFPYILEGTAKLYFAIVEPNQPFEEGVVRKILTEKDININDGTAKLVLLPQDTENLRPGTYYYEAKLDIDGQIDTVVTRHKIFIL